jgi:MFS family permease
MSSAGTDELIDRLTKGGVKVSPLAPPGRRASITIVFAAALGAILILAAGDMDGMRRRYSGQEWLMVAESAAMLATFLAALVGAFMLSIPGRSRGWRLAPLLPFLCWFVLSGIGCLASSAQPELDHSTDCLTFISLSSLATGLPLLWLLAKARPIEPMPVALLGGLAAAALSAFLLQFFHPFALTPVDFAVHFAAILLVLAVAASFRRTILRSA